MKVEKIFLHDSVRNINNNGAVNFSSTPKSKVDLISRDTYSFSSPVAGAKKPSLTSFKGITRFECEGKEVKNGISEGGFHSVTNGYRNKIKGLYTPFSWEDPARYPDKTGKDCYKADGFYYTNYVPGGWNGNGATRPNSVETKLQIEPAMSLEESLAYSLKQVKKANAAEAKEEKYNWPNRKMNEAEYIGTRLRDAAIAEQQSRTRIAKLKNILPNSMDSEKRLLEEAKCCREIVAEIRKTIQARKDKETWLQREIDALITAKEKGELVDISVRNVPYPDKPLIDFLKKKALSPNNVNWVDYHRIALPKEMLHAADVVLMAHGMSRKSVLALSNSEKQDLIASLMSSEHLISTVEKGMNINSVIKFGDD